MTKPFKIALFISISALVFFLVFKKEKKVSVLSYSTFKTNTGWGYDILLNKTIFIHQENMPVVEKPSGFTKEIYAKQTAELILTKLLAKKSPSVSSFELQNILQSN
jgi:hypothetical protein